MTCPPYDVIGDGGIATWEAADPYNVVRLILPRGSPHGDRYEHAARDLNDWLARGVLRVDSEPALYVYEHSGNAGTAVGLVGAISLHDPADNVVLAHEDVLPGPVADRTELMAATRAQLEPILLTYGGGGPASAAVDAAPLTEPIIATKTADGAQHRIWRLISPPPLRRSKPISPGGRRSLRTVTIATRPTAPCENGPASRRIRWRSGTAWPCSSMLTAIRCA